MCVLNPFRMCKCRLCSCEAIPHPSTQQSAMHKLSANLMAKCQTANGYKWIGE